jgi:pre-mRNA-splicing factor RBM22/SLT11
MPNQIKQDLNRSGWETTDFPSVCETCLPDNPFVRMLKEDYGMSSHVLTQTTADAPGLECKICSRPFTVFRWKADRTSRPKRTNICLTCARLKNCCQSCMLDLAFGLSIPVRDAALKMIAPGPTSDVNKQFYAQEHERELEEGRGEVAEAYAKTNEKARDLLRKLARSEPYRRREADSIPGGVENASGPGPIRTKDSKAGPSKAVARGPRIQGNQPKMEDILPPRDPNIASLFVTGVEEDLPQHAIETFFTQWGSLRSVVISHRAHCGYINFQTRLGAEAAAEACQGKAIIAGCPVRVRWGKPKKLDGMDDDERLNNLEEGRRVHQLPKGARRVVIKQAAEADQEEDLDSLVAAAPPGAGDVTYASLAGN